jgi:hypothetical protein
LAGGRAHDTLRPPGERGGTRETRSASWHPKHGVYSPKGRINQHPQFKIEIAGHTDSIGSDAWNAILSKRRAESVAKYLTAHGVDESRIVSVTGVGPNQPIAGNKTSEGRSKNRRVEISAEPIRVRTN